MPPGSIGQPAHFVYTRLHISHGGRTVMLNKYKHVKPRRNVWVAVRYDGKYWAGEYRQYGNTFVATLKQAYLWGSLSACECAIRNTHYNTAKYRDDTLTATKIRYDDTL